MGNNEKLIKQGRVHYIEILPRSVVVPRTAVKLHEATSRGLVITTLTIDTININTPCSVYYSGTRTVLDFEKPSQLHTEYRITEVDSKLVLTV